MQPGGREKTGASLRGLDRGERAALLVNECQPAIVDPSLAMFEGLAQAVASRGVIGIIASFAEVCRSLGTPVVHCLVRLAPAQPGERSTSALQAVMRRNPLLLAGRAESGLHPGIGAAPGDIVCERADGVTAFHGCDLEERLQALGVQTVILTGVSTNIALLGTAIEAVNRGFAVVIPEDATAGASAQTHAHAIAHTLPLLATITTSRAVQAALRRGSTRRGDAG